MDEQDRDHPDVRPIDSLRMEEGAEELLLSPETELYLKLAIALEAGQPLKPVLEEISRLPLEKRYIWRVVSALKWAFVDLETLSVGVDRKTLSREDLHKVLDLLRLRPVQFCLFLRALLGTENMEQIMSEAIQQAKGVPGTTL